MANPKDLPRLRLNSTDDFDFKESWDTAFNSQDLATAQKNIDATINTVESTFTSAQSHFEVVNGYFSSNATAITSAVNVITDNIDLQAVESAISQFEEVAGVVVRGLDELAKLHPFVGVAVMAFKLVYTLDTTRRENNKRVMVIKLQMKDMMIVLFELRHVKDANEVGPDGTSISGRMQTLLKDISEEIKQCGSACDAYLKKGFFSKTFKSKIYADRLARWGDVFEGRKEDISFALTMHTAVGVDRANVKLDGVGDGVHRVEKKMDAILTLFKKFESPRETELMKFIDDNGGIQACLASDKLISELQKREGGKRQELDVYKKRIKKEAEEDVDEVLKKNFDLFSRKLELQSQQLDDIDETIRTQGEQIISVFLAGSHDAIVNRDLKRIWQIGGWKGSVKARHFVLTLYDYYEDHQDELCNSNVASPHSAVPPKSALESTSTGLPSIRTLATLAIQGRRLKHSRWALNFVNVSHLQPIIEAIDDDGTGYVTIKECNTFATGRPEGWSLLHWLAYWASGWHLSLTQYHSKIHSVISQMFTAVKHVLPENRLPCDGYLLSDPMNLIEKLLRSTRTRVTSDNRQAEEQLAAIVASYADGEEKRLDAKLNALAYNLDLRSTVTLVTGPGRIERFLFPLLYLLLKQHLNRILLATTRLLDSNEFEASITSLSNIFGLVQERVNDLEAIFKQTAHAVDKRMAHFAYGMFHVGYNENDDVLPKLYCLDLPKDFDNDEHDQDDSARDEHLEDSVVAHREASRKIDASILIESSEFDAHIWAFEVYNDLHAVYPHPYTCDGPQVTFQPPSRSYSEASLLPFEEAPVPHDDVQGVWCTELTIWMHQLPLSWIGPIEVGFRFEDSSSSNYAIRGVAQSAAGRYVVTGIYFPITHRIALCLTFIHGTEEIVNLVLRGVVDFDIHTIQGVWRRFPASEPSPQIPIALSNEDFAFDDAVDQTFTLTRTPVEYYRYRTVPYRGVVTVARCRWRYALGAVIHQVRRAAWSWNHIREHCIRRRWFTRTRLESLLFNTDCIAPTASMQEPDPLWDFRRIRPDVAPANAQLWARCELGDVSEEPSASWDEEAADAILTTPLELPPSTGSLPPGKDADQGSGEVTVVTKETSPATATEDTATELLDHWYGVWNGHLFYYQVTGELCTFQGMVQLRFTSSVAPPTESPKEVADSSKEEPEASGLPCVDTKEKPAGDSQQTTSIEGQNMHGQMASSDLTVSRQKLTATFTTANGARISATFTYDDEHDRLEGSWQLMSDITTPIAIGRERFCLFTRTPSSLLKYRPMPNTTHLRRVRYVARNIARERWAFLKRCILHLLRKRRWASLYFKERIDERRSYVESRRRERVDLQSGFRAIDRASHANTDLLYHTYPSDTGHSILAIVLKDFRRVQRHQGYTCDVCDKSILDIRITCLDCTPDDFADSIDLCEVCADKSCERDGLDHKPSHAVLRCATYLFDNRYAAMVEKGKASWKEYKSTFAHAKAEAASQHDDNADQEDAATTLLDTSAPKEVVLPQCTYCDKKIEPPFWGCIECPSELYICPACANRHPDALRPPVSGHTWTHLLVRVWEIDKAPDSEDDTSSSSSSSDSNPDAESVLSKERVSLLEGRMVEAEAAAKALVSSVNPRFEALEVRLDGVRNDFEPRLQRLEDSMGRIEGLLGALVQSMTKKSEVAGS